MRQPGSTRQQVSLGNKYLLGIRAAIMSDIRIGDEVIVGAMSVVT
jgi:serine acetyltransferase